MEYTYGVVSPSQDYSRTDSRVSDEEFQRRVELVEKNRADALVKIATYQNLIADSDLRLEALQYVARIRNGESVNGETPKGGLYPKTEEQVND